jgi:hypothetical protein
MDGATPPESVTCLSPDAVSQGGGIKSPNRSRWLAHGVTEETRGQTSRFFIDNCVEVANLLVGSLLTGTDVPEVGALSNDGTGLTVGVSVHAPWVDSLKIGLAEIPRVC